MAKSTKRKRSSTSRYRKYAKRAFAPSVYQVAKLLQLKHRIGEAEQRYGYLRPMLNEKFKLNEGADDLNTVLSGLALRGKGAYGWDNVARSAGGSISKAFGGSRRSGRKIGGLVYDTARPFMDGVGGYIPRTRGSGSYEMNSLIEGSSAVVPNMQGSDEVGTITVTHKEFLGTISGSQLFENVGFSINPGLATSFPWLSQIAANYEEYDFIQLVYCYTSLLSDSTASGAVGQIIMTTNYNAGQQIYQTTNAMLNNIGTTCGRPIDTPMLHGVECDDEKNVQDSHFIRTGAVPQGQDVKTYDLGIFQIATEGMPADGQLQGQLWVSYQVQLRKPRIFSALGRAIKIDALKSDANINLNYMFGNPISRSPNNSIGCTLSRVTKGFRINFPVDVVDGIYRLDMFWRNIDDAAPGLYEPTITYQSASAYVPSANAMLWQAGQDGFNAYWVEQIGYYFTLFFVLNGNNIDPCAITLQWPTLTDFLASYFNMSITQLNPDIVASTDQTIPPEWPITAVS